MADRHKPDLAVLDFRLSGHEKGSSIRPLLKDSSIGILYASGDRLNDILTKEDGEACIQKPYPLNDIVIALRIINEIKNGKAPTDVFPKNFYLLDGSVPATRFRAA